MLCRVLEETLGSPFADATNLSGRYDFEVHSQGIDSTDFLQALRDRLGLVATIRPQATWG